MEERKNSQLKGAKSFIIKDKSQVYKSFSSQRKRSSEKSIKRRFANECNCDLKETLYKVIKTVIKKDFKFKERRQTTFWHLKWTDKSVETFTLRTMKPYQRINHFPGMYHISRKDNLAFHLTEMKANFPKEYNIFPKTFVLPCHKLQLEAYMRKNQRNWIIIKPQASAEGKGVKLIKKSKEVQDLNEHIAQKYISNPLLLDGFKFDLRIYVLLLSIDPLKICIYKDGLVRLATKEYNPPSKANKNLLYQHLTNYSINKRNPDYNIPSSKELKEDSSNFKGFKRSMKEYFHFFDIHKELSLENQNKGENLWEDIKDLTRKLICSIQPILEYQYKSSTKYIDYPSLCFEVLGIDVMIDKDYKPWILEVNHSPNFHTDSELDHRIKTNLITDTLKSVRVLENCKLIESQMDKNLPYTAMKDVIHETIAVGDYEEIFHDLSDEEKIKYFRFISKAKEIWEVKCGKTKAEAKKRYSLLKLEQSLSKNQTYLKNLDEKIALKRSTSLKPVPYNQISSLSTTKRIK